jgi:hypothetical protein
LILNQSVGLKFPGNLLSACLKFKLKTEAQDLQSDDPIIFNSPQNGRQEKNMRTFAALGTTAAFSFSAIGQLYGWQMQLSTL